MYMLAGQRAKSAKGALGRSRGRAKSREAWQWSKGVIILLFKKFEAQGPLKSTAKPAHGPALPSKPVSLPAITSV